jgi:hypothetical protein
VEFFQEFCENNIKKKYEEQRDRLDRLCKDGK